MNFLTPEQQAQIKEARNAALAALDESRKQTELLTDIRDSLRVLVLKGDKN